MDRFHYRMRSDDDDCGSPCGGILNYNHFNRYSAASSLEFVHGFSNRPELALRQGYPTRQYESMLHEGGLAMPYSATGNFSSYTNGTKPTIPVNCLKDTPRTTHRKIVMASISMSTLSPKSGVYSPVTQPNGNMNVSEVMSLLVAKRTRGRVLPKEPERVLDAPNYVDDFYLKLIDWGACQLLAVALGPCLYVWDPVSGQAQELLPITSNNRTGTLYISSLKWIPSEDAVLAVGISDGRIEIWDVTTCKKLRTIKHDPVSNIVCQSAAPRRIGSLAWNRNILSSGNRTGQLYYSDVRSARPFFRKITEAHRGQEVCGLAWSSDGLQLATGGNDNVVNIFELAEKPRAASRTNETRDGVPLFNFTSHRAAVKALAWCPWKARTLATGGGTADQRINLWNTTTGQQLSSTPCGSAVTGLLWSPSASYDELLSTHGYAENQLSIWDAPSMSRLAELKAHTGRILAMTVSPDGSTVVTAGADENLHFWQIYEKPKNKIENILNGCDILPHLEISPIKLQAVPNVLPQTPRPCYPSHLSMHQLNSPVLLPHQKPSPASITNIYLNFTAESNTKDHPLYDPTFFKDPTNLNLLDSTSPSAFSSNTFVSPKIIDDKFDTKFKLATFCNTPLKSPAMKRPSLILSSANSPRTSTLLE